MSIYQGSCHCGDVRFEVEGTIEAAVSCNCSICSRKAALMWFVPRSAVRLQTPDAAMGTYLFNKHVIRHRFCQRCGIHPYGEGVDPKGNAMVAVNLRCIEGIALEDIPVHHFDGKAL